MKPIQIIEPDLTFIDNLHFDCGGFGYEWECPDCKEILRWSPNRWWSLECSCRNWSFGIRVLGRPKNMNDVVVEVMCPFCAMKWDYFGLVGDTKIFTCDKEHNGCGCIFVVRIISNLEAKTFTLNRTDGSGLFKG